MKKVQGTDGVRGEVCMANSPSVRGRSPQEVFLEDGKLTEQFFELYTYSVTKFFEEIGWLAKNKRIIIGWDPRDKSTIFIEAAIRGLLKNDVEVITIGIVPTPLVSFATTYLDAAFGIMITASHNPADQNGIKVFFGYSGLKPMEKDDIRISEIFFENSYSDLVKKPLAGIRRNEEENIKNIYVAFCCSFLKRQPVTTQRRLLVDNANGSNSILSKRVFSKQEGIEIIMVNTYKKGIINHKCGVTYLEGVKQISFEEIRAFKTNLAEVPILRRLVRESELIEEELLAGKRLLSGIVFDGDGDRIMWIEVDVKAKLLHVLSGDEIAGNLIMEKGSGFANFYVNTIESDVNTLQHAEAQACKTLITPVGDKWLILGMLKKTIRKLLGKLEEDRSYRENMLVSIEKVDSSADLALLYREVCFRYQKELAEQGRFLLNRKLIGSEKSGHVIFSRVLKTEKVNYIPIFTGNALEIAAEFSKVTPKLLELTGIEEFHQKLANPFPEGLNETAYLYYTDRSLFYGGSPLFENLKLKIPHLAIELSGGSVMAFYHEVENDPNVLFFNLKNEDDTKLCFYVRNSGTEAKTGFSIRGDKKYEDFMVALSEKTMEFTDRLIRDRDNPYFTLGIELLLKLSEGEHTNLDFIDDIETNLSKERLKKEFFFSEKNIAFKDGVVKVTKKGDRLLESHYKKKKL